MKLSTGYLAALAAGLCLGLSGCAPLAPAEPQAAPPEEQAPVCQGVLPGEPLVGNWLVVSSQKGVAGTIRILITLNPDGTMGYVEQIKRPNAPSQGLYEAGCWYLQAGKLVLRTLESNGTPVNLQDPIYTNELQVLAVSPDQLRLNINGREQRARRMSPGYRLPF